MKRFLLLLCVLLLVCAAGVALAAEAPFAVGEDQTEYVVDGSSGWNTETVYVRIAAGEDVLFSGTVTLTSDNLFASEFTYAAIVEAGIGSEGVLEGFVNAIGDYVGGSDAEGNYVFWGYSVNGKYAPFACNQMRLLEGDYLSWEFQVYDEEAVLNAEALPTGFDAPFTVGGDETEYEVDGASGWTFGTINMQIVAGEAVIYDGIVNLKSDNMLVSEATYAAIVEAGVGAEGVLEGFVTSIGDYVGGTDADGNYVYWGFTVNGKNVPFACNQMPLLDQDYVLWELQVYAAE